MAMSEEEYNQTYEIVKFLDEGAFGKVFSAKQKSDKCATYAVKRIRLKEDEKIRKRLIRERECLCKLDHPNVVKYIGCAVLNEAYESKSMYINSQKKNSYW